MHSGCHASVKPKKTKGVLERKLGSERASVRSLMSQMISIPGDKHVQLVESGRPEVHIQHPDPGLPLSVWTIPMGPGTGG